jgi:hypothetical protein
METYWGGYNTKYVLHDMIYVGLQRRCLAEKLGDECQSLIHVACGCVLLALAQMLYSIHLTLGVICPESVV